VEQSETRKAERPSTYRDLVTWQKAMDFVDGVYDASTGWPRSELFALTSQIRRAAVSVSANVAEGYGRFRPREYAHHVSIAHGSLLEVETLVTIACRRNFINRETELRLLERAAEVCKLLNGLYRSLPR
jgi:four helix bundle protein